ncbi:ABC transporter ATP-binding protein [Aestuariimicrobium kwangyangense]|uniref:ABC transporter ATP-binding protein n=1 Tax=Aestuariimicrobium kwangyangense TaxID=396389 RepID=UPI00041E56D5|nr:ABC transporter ATP-binding protein [Aestuariimicrobium kwangyangense]
MAPMLQVRDLTVRFGRRQQLAVEGLDLDLDRGARVGLIGESGSGKSVTALAIMGLLPENAHVTGSIRLEGTELVGRSDRHLTRLRGDALGMVFQEPMTALDPTMKAGRQVAEVYRLHGRGGAKGHAREAVIGELAAMGLGEPERVADSYPHQLSGGQRQRVLMAMALANRPNLVICDEPTTALDVTVQARVLQTLRRRLDVVDDAQQTGAACLFISHDLAVVASMCDHLLVMRNGRVVERGSLHQVISGPRHPYTRGLMATSRLDLASPGSRLPTIEEGA